MKKILLFAFTLFLFNSNNCMEEGRRKEKTCSLFGVVFKLIWGKPEYHPSDYKKYTPEYKVQMLGWAERNKKFDLIKALLQASANPFKDFPASAATAGASSAMSEALANHNTQAVRIFLEQTNKEQWPQDLIVSFFCWYNLIVGEMVELLVELGADVNGKNQWGESPLFHLISCSRELEKIEKFLTYKPTLDEKSIQESVRNENIRSKAEEPYGVVQLLIEYAQQQSPEEQERLKPLFKTELTNLSNADLKEQLLAKVTAFASNKDNHEN